MNELTAFQFEEGREVRTLERDGEPWFVAKDVCDILGLENSRDVLAKNLDDDEKGVENIYTLGGKQDMNIISESGLYNLIFRSSKPEAKAFRKWVTSEVIPSIRKNGYYAVPALMARLEKALDDPKKAAYEELERFVQKNIMFDEKSIHVASVDHLYHDYENEAERLLDKREFMHKIAIDHPEFGMAYKKKRWLFTNCYQCYRHNR